MAHGPGRSYRRGMSLMELFKRFPDDETAEAWFAKVRWRDGLRCPRGECGSDNVQFPTTHPTMPYRCRSCRRFFSVKTGTVMQDSKLGYQVWAIAIFLFNTGIKGVSSMKLHRDLGVTQKTAWHLAHRIREVWNEFDELPNFLGPVQADETWLGGLDRNRPKHRRQGREWRKFRIPVVGVYDEVTHEVNAEVVESVDSATLVNAVESRLAHRVVSVQTDENPAYNPIIRHYWVNHGDDEYVAADGVTTNGIESFWSMLKRGYHGTYHWYSRKHAQRYVNEFAGRQSWRPRDTDQMMASSVVAMEGKRLTYAELIE